MKRAFIITFIVFVGISALNMGARLILNSEPWAGIYIIGATLFWIIPDMRREWLA